MTEDELYNMSDEELEAAMLSSRTDPEDDGESYEDNEPEEELQEEEDNSEDDDQEVDVDEDEQDEDLEQPDEDVDSDDNASEDDETNESEEDVDPGEDNDVDTVPEVEPDAQPTPIVHKFKANGKDFEFTPEEIADQFPKVFGQAMDYTKKMQAMKPWRKQIDALEQNNVKPEDLNLMLDVLNGNKEALTEVMKRTGVNTFDLDTEAESNYVPKDYGRDAATLDLQDVITEIERDPEYEKTRNVLNNEWDAASWDRMKADPKLIKGLHIDVKSGRYDELSSSAEKLKLYDGGEHTDLEYYMEAARRDSENKDVRLAQTATDRIGQNVAAKLAAEKQKIADVKANQTKVTAQRESAVKRKAAAPVTKVAGNKKVVDYLDDSEEAFEEWYKKLQDNQ